jgi:2,3-bisphosphoglycerate-independent phosphoglycerate mutase
MELEGLTFSLAHVWRGESILRISGGADERVTDSDAFFRAWQPMLRPQPLVPEAERTARACEEWTREVMRRLEGERFNVITLKWFGRPRRVPSFLERHGVTGAFAADSAFLRGLGRALGLEPVDAPETDDAVADLRARIELARARLDAGDTFVFCHQKTTDAAGHTKDPRIKQQTIERLDAALGGLRPLVARAIVCVTGDHATPASPNVIHSGDPVPLLVAGPGVRADRVDRFGELDCAEGILGHLCGPDLMPVLLNAADRPLFLGSRPTPFDGADGYPAVLEPLL